MKDRRFVDYARHGGCSMKLEPGRLRKLLGSLRAFSDDDAEWPDASISPIGNGKVASSVDIVLPMIDDPGLFGRIVVNHVLSDLYAVGASPVFALSILGMPEPDEKAGDREKEAFNRRIDGEVRQMLIAADEELAEAKVLGGGGHTLMDHVLFFGMAATGSLPPGGEISHKAAAVGDALVLTKPLGTSIATKLWKTETDSKEEFGDVIAGMLRSNRVASEAMLKLERCACTDITGFGLCGHLHNMMRASRRSATLAVADVPIYESVTKHRYASNTETRIFEPNRKYLDAHLRNLDSVEERALPIYLDAQVSGGLLISMSPGEVGRFTDELKANGEKAWVVGEVGNGEPGTIALR